MSHIAVVDDKADMRDVLRRHLEKAGYQVTAVASAEEALKLLAVDKVELLVTDLKMPGMDGLDLLRKSKQMDPDLGVLVMTAYGTVEDAVLAIKAGAFDFLLKPFSMEELVLKVEKYLQVRSLKGKNLLLQEELKQRQGKMLGESPAMRQVYETIARVSQNRATVLLTGESGTGKELAAQAIHQSSSFHEAPFIRVHCAALAPNLLESELFGHEKGAFTGAIERRAGRFELVQGGTLFLDEISEVSPDIQVKLLRVLQEREFERVGGTKTLRVDFRLIAATNRDLKAWVSQGKFREDLYYRLNVVNIHLPPLRERREDIPLLCTHFLNKFCREMGKAPKSLSLSSLEVLRSYAWPGNVRELQNLLERAVALADPSPEQLEVIPDIALPASSVQAIPWKAKGDLAASLDEIEKNIILQALTDCGGVQNETARKLGISRSTLQYKIKKYRLEGLAHESS